MGLSPLICPRHNPRTDGKDRRLSKSQDSEGLLYTALQAPALSACPPPYSLQSALKIEAALGYRSRNAPEGLLYLVIVSINFFNKADGCFVRHTSKISKLPCFSDRGQNTTSELVVYEL